MLKKILYLKLLKLYLFLLKDLIMNYTFQHNMKYLTHALQFEFNFPNREMSLSSEKTGYIDMDPLVLATVFPCLVHRSIGLKSQKASGGQRCSVCRSLNYRRNLPSADGLYKYEFRLNALKICKCNNYCSLVSEFLEAGRKVTAL